MRLFKEGERSKALCDHCQDVVATTFERRDVPFSDGSATARNILVGVCAVCGRTVSIPAQSTPAIARSRKEAPQSLEANLPAIYVDVLDCAAHAIDNAASSEFRRVLLTYFVHKSTHDPRAVKRLKKAHERALLRYPEERGAARRRLSMKVPPRVSRELRELEAQTELNTTELLKSVVCEIQELVLDEPKASLIEELRTLAAIAL
jgi:hypothetical protein